MPITEEIKNNAVLYANEEIPINKICIFKKAVPYIKLIVFIDEYIKCRVKRNYRISYFHIGAIIGIPTNCNELSKLAINRYMSLENYPDVIGIIKGKPTDVEKGFNFMVNYFDSASNQENNGIKSIW
jgi:hypothetical protein